MARTDGLEIERKFLLPRFPAHVKKQNGIRMRQGYISPETADVEVRVRSTGEEAFLTMKKGRGMRRREEEIAITLGSFDRFWPFTEGARIEKTRYYVDENDITIEIDVYGGQCGGQCGGQSTPLIVAEVELPQGADFIGMALPDWLGSEITGLPEYTNQHIARHGTPKREISNIGFRPITHAGAIPYRWRKDNLQILCITTRNAKRWIVPKGYWDAGCDLHEIAAQEAWEEAGVTGALDTKAIGIYEDIRNDRCSRIELFPLMVEEEKEKWPEMNIRERNWMSVKDAMATVSFTGIAALIEKLQARLSIDDGSNHL